MHSCIFCQIVQHAIPARIVYEDEQVVAFHDIQPVAPVHVLIVPTRHIPTIHDLIPAESPILGQLFGIARTLAEQLGIHQTGYRTVFNCNRDAGQTVFHVHLHLIGGKVLSWP